jgi:hypothetical protein
MTRTSAFTASFPIFFSHFRICPNACLPSIRPRLKSKMITGDGYRGSVSNTRCRILWVGLWVGKAVGGKPIPAGVRIPASRFHPKRNECAFCSCDQCWVVGWRCSTETRDRHQGNSVRCRVRRETSGTVRGCPQRAIPAPPSLRNARRLPSRSSVAH